MKKYQHHAGWGALLAWVFLMSLADAETPAAPSGAVNLQDAVRMGLQQNFNLLAARQGVREAQAVGRGAYDGFLPRLQVEQTWMSSDNPVNVFAAKLNQAAFRQQDFAVDLLNRPDRVTDNISRATLQIPIFNGGGEYVALALAKEGVRKAESMNEVAEEEVVYQITRAFYDAVAAREAQALAAEAVKTAEASLSLITSRSEQGLVVKSDLLMARLRLTQVRQAQETADNRAGLAQRSFNLLLGDVEGGFVPDGELSFQQCPTLDPEELTNAATKSRRDLAVLRADLALARKRIGLARAALLPSVNAQASYEYHGSEPFRDGADNTTVGLTLSIPLFQGMSRYAEIQRGKEEVLRLEWQIRALEQQIRLEVAQALSDIGESESRIRLMKESVEQAEESLNLVKARYEEGAATVVELQQVELVLAQMRMERLLATFDHLIAQARLCKATGNAGSGIRPEARD